MNNYDLTGAILTFMDKKKIRAIGRKPTMWPSQARASTPLGIIGKCLREAYWLKKGELPTNPVSPQVKLMGFMGLQIEDGLIDICRNLGLWRGNNIKWYNEVENVSGEIDVIIGVRKSDLLLQNFEAEFLDRFKDTDEILFNIECKSCSGYYINKEVFGHYAGRGANRVYIPGYPKEPHLLQSSLYADVTKDKCAGTILIYFSRDEAKMCQFLITSDEQSNILVDGVKEQRFNIESIYESYRELQVFLDEDKLPPCDYKNTYTDNQVRDLYARKMISKTVHDKHIDKKQLYLDKGCEYCAFKDRCLNLTAPAVQPLPEGFAHGSY